MRIDLHTHSRASDGSDEPAQLVCRAAKEGLDVLALTDHDTVAGLTEARCALPEGLTLVPGVELSCHAGDISLHLLAYLFDPADPDLTRESALLREDRVRRARAIVDRCRDLGAAITWESVHAIAGEGAIGRPHIASALAGAGVVRDIEAAFSADWIGDGGRAYVAKYTLEARRAIDLVRAAGGAPVFAHPGADARGRIVSDDVIESLAAAGLVGLEVDHPDHDLTMRTHLRGLAGDLGLVVTGSSDYHGTRKGVRLGEFTTDPEAYEAIVAAGTGTRPVRG
ncbi:MAG: PHP domain-containing protein [Carbonactinosporaceae bacterium]